MTAIPIILLAPILLAPSVIYPPPTVPLRFDHAAHTSQTCASCHPVASSTRVVDRNLPGESVCLACHDPFAEPSPARVCSQCHPNYRPLLPAKATSTRAAIPAPSPIEQPPAHLKFSHAQHQTPCVTCHGDMSKPAADHLPSMATCLTCHDGKKAPDQCATCHLSRPDGRLRTQFPKGALRPQDHGPDFTTHHNNQATANADACTTCHSPPECRTCHQGATRPLGIHPADYVLSHGPPARRNDPNCSSCHRVATFCRSCHQLAGASQTPSPDRFGLLQGNRRDYHPPGWNDPFGPPGPQHHRIEARRSITTCVSCHQESDCVTCHGINTSPRATPHPPGFARHCGMALDASARGCLKCHTDRSALDRLCGR